MPGEAGPVVQLKFVDAIDLFITWRWEHALHDPRVIATPRHLVQPVLDAWAEALPLPRPDETPEQAVRRALRGPLLDRDAEIELSTALARALFPARLAGEVNEQLAAGRRPHLRIQSSASTALVPWEALRVDEGERLVHICDVSALLPAAVRNAPGRAVSSAGTAAAVCVIDPLVPGGVLAPVLPPVSDDSPLGAQLLGGDDTLLVAAPGALSRRRIVRDELRPLLARADRLLYVGHVSSGSHGLDVRLHLSCTAKESGAAEAIGPHRPLSAADLAGWRFPPRVALVACDSGADAGYAEPAGLVSAMIAGGAEYVTAARWTLPTDAAFPADAQPFTAAVIAANAAQRAGEPVRALNTWQRTMADRWEGTADLGASPLVWAALSTAWAPGTPAASTGSALIA